METRRMVRNSSSMAAVALILFSLFLLFSLQAYAVPMPQGVVGTVYELDGVTQVPEGIHFSVNNTANGFYHEGLTGRPTGTGDYAASVEGEIGNSLIIRAWNVHNNSVRTISLSGVMKNVNFLLDMSFENEPPYITSSPPVPATEDILYTYAVTAEDFENQPLEYSLTTAPATMSINSTSGLLEWLPGNDDVGLHDVGIEVSDGEYTGTQNFTLEVDNVNDAPVITSSPATSVLEDTLYTYQITALDVDVGDVLQYLLVSAPAGMTINSTSGLVRWIPDNEDVGNHTVTVRVSDGELVATQPFVLEVINVNDAPVIHSIAPEDAVEDTLYQYQVDATDVDSTLLTYTLLDFPAGMTISSSGLIEWTPANDDVGPHSVTVIVTDGELNDTQSYTLTVANVNDAPYITSLPVTAAVQDTLYEYTIIASDIDNTQEELSYSLVAYPVGMTLETSSGLVSWTPTNDDVGMHNITVRVSDGLLSDEQSYALVVENMNDAPTILSLPVTSALEDEEYTYQVEAIDIDGDGLTYALNSSPEGMVIATVNESPGIVMWTPTNDDVGEHIVIVVVSDGTLHALQEYVLTVTNTNDAPVVTSTPSTAVDAGSTYTYTIIAIDDDNDTLTYILEQGPIGMALNEQLLTWTPSDSDAGQHTVLLRVSDDTISTSQQFILIVTASSSGGGRGGGGGGGAAPIVPGSPPQKTRTVLEKFLGKSGALVSVNVSINTSKDSGISALVKAKLLVGRPRDVPTHIMVPVYQYLEITVQPTGGAVIAVNGVEIVFNVERAWLEEREASYDDVVLLRFDGSVWEELPTVIISEGESDILYKSTSSSLSYFAIILSGESAGVQLLGEIEDVGAPLKTYSFGGIIYAGDGKQVPRGTRFVLENTYLGERVEGKTGESGSQGSFSAQIQANAGDTLRLSVEGNEHVWFTVFKDMDSLEMRTGLSSKKKSALTGFATAVADRTHLSENFLLLSFCIICLIIGLVVRQRVRVKRARKILTKKKSMGWLRKNARP